MEILFLIVLVIILFEIPICIGMGLIFKKMNLEFKKGIIPFYNKIILIKKYKLSQYHLILIFIPIITLYTNFIINKQLAKENEKTMIDAIELTLFPFIYNIFFALDIKQKQQEIIETNNFFEEQKKIYEQQKQEEKEEYYWYPKQKIKNDTIYKASRNNLNAKVNIDIKKNNEIIDNKRQVQNKKQDIKICPKCGTKIPTETEICYICGTKL